MTANYFKVGEEVILKSVSRPELNCECTVVGAFNNGDIVEMNDKERIWAVEPSYKLSIDGPERFGRTWGQPSLRKKYKGCGGFDSLIGYLESGKVESV